EINHHDRVFLHDTYEQNDADEGNKRKIMIRKNQSEQRAHTRRRKAGQNRDRMDVAFIKNTQNDVNNDDSRQNQERLALERSSKLAAVRRHRKACRRSLAAVY